MNKYALIGGLLAAMLVSTHVAQADLMVSPTDLRSKHFNVDSTLDLEYTIVNDGGQDCSLKTSIQIIDELGVVLFASPWSAIVLDSHGRKSCAWRAPYLKDVLRAASARSLCLNVWVEAGPRQFVAHRTELVRVKDSSLAIFEPANPSTGPGHSSLARQDYRIEIREGSNFLSKELAANNR